MTCAKITNGFLCSGTEAIKKITLKDGTDVVKELRK